MQDPQVRQEKSGAEVANVRVNIQGGKQVDLGEVPLTTKVGEIRISVLRVAKIVERPNERWELEYRGEVLDDELTLGQVREEEPGDPQTVVMRLYKRQIAGVGERGASAPLA